MQRILVTDLQLQITIIHSVFKLKSTLKAPIIIYQLNRLEKSDLLKITLTHCGGGDTKWVVFTQHTPALVSSQSGALTALTDSGVIRTLSHNM